MPYIVDQSQDEEENQNKGNTPPAQTGGGGLIQGTGASSAQTTPGSGAPTNSGAQFTNINQYLDANKDQSADLTKQVTGTVSNAADQAKSQIDSANQDFASKVNANTVNSDKALVDSAADTAPDFVKDQSKVDAFAKQRDANYTGPASFDSYDQYVPLQKSVVDTDNKIQGLSTEQGQRDILSGLEKNPTRGNTSLNQAVLAADPNAQTAFQQVQSQYKDLPTYLDSVRTSGNQLATTAAQNTAAAKQYVQDKFIGNDQSPGAIQQFQNNLSSQAADAERKRVALANDFSKPAAQMTDEELATLGVSRDQMAYLQNIGAAQHYGASLDQLAAGQQDPSSGIQTNLLGSAPQGWFRQYMLDTPTGFDNTKYLSNGGFGTPISLANYAKPEDYARYQALNQLVNQNGTFLDQNNVAQAGTGKLATFDYNTALKNAADEKQAAIQARYNNIFNKESAAPASQGSNYLKYEAGKDRDSDLAALQQLLASAPYKQG